MADSKISLLTNYTTPLAADVLPIVDTANTTTKKVTVANLGATGSGLLLNGFSANATPTANNIPVLDANANLFPSGWFNYSAVTPTTGTFDAPSYPIAFAGVDLTSILSVGMKVKITQSTVKYFIITAIAFSTNTTVTLYGGTDYTLVASGTTAISAFSFSPHKTPLGFPLSSAKWTESLVSNAENYQGSPSAATWYNLSNNGTSQLSIPIGAWSVAYSVMLGVRTAAAVTVQVNATLSTANNSESDSQLSVCNWLAMYTGGEFHIRQRSMDKIIALASKTIYYLNSSVNSGTNITYVMNENGVSNMEIKAICAYL